MTENDTTETATKSKKLTKSFEGTVLTLDFVDGSGPKTFDFNDLPKEMQAALGPFGLGHKLSDAASALRGVEAEARVSEVWAGLMANEWSTKGTPTPKVSVNAILDNFGKLSAKEKKSAAALLASLGIEVPEGLME